MKKMRPRIEGHLYFTNFPLRVPETDEDVYVIIQSAKIIDKYIKNSLFVHYSIASKDTVNRSVLSESIMH